MSTAYKPNWFSVLNTINSFVSEFMVGVEKFKITKLPESESNYIIENITDSLLPIIVYELTRGKVYTYSPVGDWETFLLLYGKAIGTDEVVDNQQYWNYTVGVTPSIEELDY